MRLPWLLLLLLLRRLLVLRRLLLGAAAASRRLAAAAVRPLLLLLLLALAAWVRPLGGGRRPLRGHELHGCLEHCLGLFWSCRQRLGGGEEESPRLREDRVSTR